MPPSRYAHLTRKNQIESLPLSERGALVDAKAIAEQVFSNLVKPSWVLANVPVRYRHKIGRCRLYYVYEVRQWVESQRLAD